MNTSVLVTGVLMALSLTTFVLLIYFIHLKKKIPGKFLLEVFLTSELIYVFGYTCELVSDVVSQKIFYNHFQHIGLVLIIPVWYLISLQYANVQSKWLKLKYLVFVIPVIALIGNFTHMSNHFYYQSYIPSNNNSGLFVILYEKGILYYIFNAFQSIMAIFSALNYYNVYKEATGRLKKQSCILMGLSIIGFFLAASYIFSRYTSSFDKGAVLVGFSAFILLITLFKYEVFDLLPLAYVKVFESNGNPIIILDDSKSIVKCNAAAIKVFGDKLKNHTVITEVFNDEPELLNTLASNKNSIIKRTVDGKQMYFSAKLDKLDIRKDDVFNEYGYLLTFTNETEHINEVHMLENAAYVDPLTGVYNRRFFFEKANQALKDAKSGELIFSLIMIDVDKFKDINDSFGHISGDFVLKKVCSVIQSHLTCKDIVARYGGEEFIILLPDSDFDTSMKVAERICRSIQQKHFKHGEEKIEVTVSLGVYTPRFPLSGSEEFEHFIAAVDHCLYHAKKDGRNRIFGANGAINNA